MQELSLVMLNMKYSLSCNTSVTTKLEGKNYSMVSAFLAYAH